MKEIEKLRPKAEQRDRREASVAGVGRVVGNKCGQVVGRVQIGKGLIGSNEAFILSVVESHLRV